MEYDFSRLSSRRFEQLAQALAVRWFGPGVVVFGDGPDGGREATFEGRMSYEPRDEPRDESNDEPRDKPDAEPWDGALVVQAKYRQRTQGTYRDGLWALRELDEELDKFARRAGDRPRPDYFVFVTNVVLSPGTGGSKDQATKMLDDAGAAWGLRDYDIWDYDKLRTWLDLNQEVRTSFGWTIDGDVLGAMFQWLQGSNPEFEQTITNYLEKTLIADRFVRLEQAGHSDAKATALSQVFVDLPIGRTNNPSNDLFMRRLLERAASPGHDLETKHRRIVLVGGPGQGKTTMGQFACQLFRAGLLASKPRESLSREGDEAVKALEAACAAAELPFGRSPRFPIRVVLTDLATALTQQEQTLLSYIAETISKRVAEPVSATLFKEWLAKSPWFLVLDGLDEVPANAGRDSVMRCIADFWVDVAQLKADIVVLATTRPQGYNDDFSPDRYEHVGLAGLSTERALDYGSRLADARHGKDSERAITVTERLARAARDHATNHLMRSPLQVAIMAALVDLQGQPPYERWSLFDAYYDVIYKREQERDTDAATILRERRPDINAIHQQVGLALQVRTTHEGYADPRLTGEQLQQIIDARLESEGHQGAATETMAAQIRSAAESRLVFLVGAQSDRIGFEVRSFQEFMAAGALVEGTDKQVIQRLRAIAPLPAWRNVLLFAAGRCFMEKQYLRPDLLVLCQELDVDTGDPIDTVDPTETDDPLPAVTKLGARIALDLLKDRIGQRQQKFHHMIAKLAFEVLSLPDEQAALDLAGCYDDDLDKQYRNALSEAVTAGEEIRRTSARKCLIALNGAGVSWAGAMLHNHLPTTTADAIETLRGLPATMVRKLDERDLTAYVELFGHNEFMALMEDHFWDNDADDEVIISAEDYYRDFERIELSIGRLPGLAFRITALTESPMICWPVAKSGLAASVDSPTTAVYRAIERFAANPTHTRLSEILEELAHSSTPEAWRPCAERTPWPMGMLLDRAASAEQLIGASEAVRAGAYGDLEAWRAAEQRWSDGQSTLIDSLSAKPVPFPIEVASCGSVKGRGHFGLPWLESFHMLSEAGATEAGARQRTRLAELMLDQMGFLGSGKYAHTEMSDVIDVARAAAPFPEQVGIKILDAAAAHPSEAITLLESLPEDTRLVHYDATQIGRFAWIDAAIMGQLERYAIDHPTARSCEALAVALSSLDAPPARIISISPEETDRIACAAAAFIAFISGDRSTDARALGTRFAVAYDTSLKLLLEGPIAQNTPGWAEFLTGIYTAAPRTWRELAGLYETIIEMMSERETPLADTTIWQQLGLPTPHPLALAAEAA